MAIDADGSLVNDLNSRGCEKYFVCEKRSLKAISVKELLENRIKDDLIFINDYPQKYSYGDEVRFYTTLFHLNLGNQFDSINTYVELSKYSGDCEILANYLNQCEGKKVLAVVEPFYYDSYLLKHLNLGDKKFNFF